MLRSLLLVLLVLAGCATVRPDAPADTSVVIATASADDPTALVAWRGGLAVAAGRTVRGIEGGAVAWQVEAPGRVLGLAGRDTLWLATDAGLFWMAEPGAAPVAVPPLAGEVLAVAQGPDGRVWASTLRDGVWMRSAGRWTEASGAAPITGLVAGDGVVWMGGPQGVTRRDASGEIRFTEEGTTEHGLLDNMTDALVGTADGVVWAIHPQGVSVFADGEPHGFRFVGRPGADLRDVVALPGGGYLLATGGGVLALASLSDRPEGFYEVFADSGADARAVSGLIPAALGGAPPSRLALGADGRTVWFASRAGVWSVPVTAFAAPLAAR